MVYGLKKNLKKKSRIISASKPEGSNLIDVVIFHLDEEFNLIENYCEKN